MPTLIEVSDANYPESYRDEEVFPIEGISLLPLLSGDSLAREKPLYYEWGSGRSIQTENWKLVKWEDEWELYDRQTDRAETTNLANDYPDTVDQLQGQWQKWAQKVGLEE